MKVCIVYNWAKNSRVYFGGVILDKDKVKKDRGQRAGKESSGKGASNKLFYPIYDRGVY